MHKLLNFFCFPALLSGAIFISHGFLGYTDINKEKIEIKSQTSNQINNLYSEKEITLKDPPISEILSDKLYVKVRVKPISPKIASKIQNKSLSSKITILSEMDYDYLSSDKKNFVKKVLPIIINENQNIVTTRNFIIDLKNKLETFRTLKNSEIRELNFIAKKYNIKYENKHKLDIVEELLLNVDIIPNSIALAQAAIESGWGNSRFAREYNALFGEYTNDHTKGVLPLEREFGDKHFIKSFSSYNNSVSSYFKNINSHFAYKEFRNLRNLMRQKNNFTEINLLVDKLDSYAEDQNYIKTLNAVIEKNNFDKFDLKVIYY